MTSSTGIYHAILVVLAIYRSKEKLKLKDTGIIKKHIITINKIVSTRCVLNWDNKNFIQFKKMEIEEY